VPRVQRPFLFRNMCRPSIDRTTAVARSQSCPPTSRPRAARGLSAFCGLRVAQTRCCPPFFVRLRAFSPSGPRACPVPTGSVPLRSVPVQRHECNKRARRNSSRAS
jgi:hypothetical protein